MNIALMKITSMRIIMKLLSLLFLLLVSSSVWSEGGGHDAIDVGKVNIELHNSASLQRGAKYFVNYCLSCHAAENSRYKRVADDLGIKEELMLENMIFTGQKYGDLMTVSMRREDAKNWFLGIIPPDLSTHVRAIGPQKVYAYLKTFYVDESRPFGVNNLHLPNTAMPHVLADLQGLQKTVYHREEHADGSMVKTFEKFELIQPGVLSEEEYDQVVVDIVNFLAYLSEPAALIRKSIGVGVLFFLALLGTLAYFLKRNYWQDVH